jgi:exonuclease VII large subunit
MKLELDILELNDLYYATSKLVDQRKRDLKDYGKNVSSVTYLTKELRKAETLCEKIQTALYAKIDEVEEAIESVHNRLEAQKEDRDYNAFKQYADKVSMEDESIKDLMEYASDPRHMCVF